jgi:hypothetical protein
VTGIQEADEADVMRRNDVQNKNIWFLDPIALNTRFLANEPSPTMEFRNPNTTRRWWLGDLTTEADAEPLVLTLRETLLGKGGLRR